MKETQKRLIREYIRREVDKRGFEGVTGGLYPDLFGACMDVALDVIDLSAAKRTELLREFAATEAEESRALLDRKQNTEIPDIEADIVFYEEEAK